MRSASANEIALQPAARLVRVIEGEKNRLMIERVDAVVCGLKRIHRYSQGDLDGHAFRIDVDSEVTAVAVHLQCVQQGLGLLGRDRTDIEILIVIAQWLTVPV